MTLASVLGAAYRKNVVGDYKHPMGMTVFGAAVVLSMSAMGAHTLVHELPKLFR